jgi:hypothetical protein
MNEKVRVEFELAAIELAHEFRDVPFSDAWPILECAWMIWKDPKAWNEVRRDNFKVIQGGLSASD